MHSKEFAGNQGKHQNWVPSPNFWLIFMGIKLKNRQKMPFFVFLGCFCPYVRQPHNHIGWVNSISFASINPTNPRTNPWNLHKSNLRIGDFEKLSFFELAALEYFCFLPMKISQSYLDIKDGSKFWWLPWFTAKE